MTEIRINPYRPKFAAAKILVRCGALAALTLADEIPAAVDASADELDPGQNDNEIIATPQDIAHVVAVIEALPPDVIDLVNHLNCQGPRVPRITGPGPITIGQLNQILDIVTDVVR